MMSPSNVPWLNPVIVDRTVREAGANLVRGAANLSDDMSRTLSMEWRSVYKLHLFTDNELTFALTNGGLNAGVVSEPGHHGRQFHIARRQPGGRYVDADTWLARAKQANGSWWPEWVSWLESHSSRERILPPAMGSPSHGLVPLCSAPGLYVQRR